MSRVTMDAQDPAELEKAQKGQTDSTVWPANVPAAWTPTCKQGEWMLRGLRMGGPQVPAKIHAGLRGEYGATTGLRLG